VDPKGTVESVGENVENMVTKIKALPEYIEQAPAEFKAYLDNISSLEDPYEQGEALGKLVGNVLPTAVVAGSISEKAFKGVKRAAKEFQKVRKGVGRSVNTTKLLQSKFPNLDKKYAKHSQEWSQWGTISREVFHKRAVDLANSPVDGYVKGFMSRNGWSFRFNTKTGEFLTIHPKGHIETFSRPEQGVDYYLKQVQLYGK